MHMNATQIARLMLVTVRAYTTSEIEVEEFNDLMEVLQASAWAASLSEETKTTYREMCMSWHAAQADK